MRTSFRAVQALALLMGFYLLALGALALIALVDFLVLENASDGFNTGALKLVAFSVVVAIPIARGVFFVRRPKDEAPPGISVSEQQQPELWARVRTLAEQVGTRAPAEIRLIPQVNAAVSENPRLLGLIPGHRRMLIGVPLLIGLTEPQLDAVLAHELGHYSNKDTRLAGITVRGRQSLITVVQHARAAGRGVTASVFGAYAKLYLRVSESVSRRQELSADLASARIAGRDHAAAAMRQLPALDLAYDFYLERYASVGWKVGYLPLASEFYGGFRSLLGSAKRQAELDEIRTEPPVRETSPYDSHPPVRERVAALEALPADGRVITGQERPALSLLHDVDHLLAAVAAVTMPADSAGKRPLPWDDLARESGRAHLRLALAPHCPPGGSVDGLLPYLLDEIDREGTGPATARLPRSAEADRAKGRPAEESARDALRGLLKRLALLGLLDQGRASYVLTWDEPLHVHYAPGVEESLSTALDAAVTDAPTTAPLRALLAPTHSQG
ncbi:M48 family metallopeptidase [Streptacidiphilus rugosus]|uniref:M48 family metallopeptidase n=1 Tax=Streptacidiphilus rugosus TaxID=405783 RepID=UPI000563E5EF|nr:M48 family metallopeptidase [Streptacidiphilus rugosus]